ncbi:spermatogenesis-associated protein 17-like [Actinia tenebrosa]|uniref:Spermatogenesis-associated protein 17-like n=1 Tax=Actinia tenebrosa TaxID=6105 RepID=A0A6P8HJZ2_ACTTE|nr:spermatogenesis-associated protein 17-like [Actinia tenebrosa]
MATFVELMGRRRDIVNKLFEDCSEAEDQRTREYEAAVRIQSWFRAVRVRAYIRFLNSCARTIQKHFRGFKGREIYRHLVKEHVARMRIKYYNSQATKIQKVWRGYYTRKYIHNFYSRKAFLEGLAVKNELVRKELNELALSTSKEMELKAQMKHKAARELEAEKTHFLISTHQIPGIYYSPITGPSQKELELREVRPLTPKTRGVLSARLRTKKFETFDDRESVSAQESMKYKVLPPINADKVQGPFRNPNEVWKQRHKSLNPSLRVATSYDSAEQTRMEMKAKEWVTRVIDDKFVPFTHRQRPYDPLLHTTSAYGSLPYGTKHFREESKQRHISSQRFESVVSPIPIFEQFGKTY